MDRDKFVLISLCVSALICGYNTVFASDYPSWWTNRNVISTSAITNDFAAVNAGQLKWIAVKAKEELDEKLAGGAGTGVNALVGSFTSSNNYLAVNAGQLKNVAAPFWTRLIEAGYTNTYPWTTNTTTDDMDYAAANIGQLKYAFSFELEGFLGMDSDGDGMSDSWENQYFGSLSQCAFGDYDFDGLNNLAEKHNNTNPTESDSDGDGICDGKEVRIFLTNPNLVDTDHDGLSDYYEIVSNNRVTAWGDNSSGQTNVPQQLSNVVDVAAGLYHSVVLCTNGKVVCWGNNSCGQTNVPAGLSNVVAISGGGSIGMALQSDGRVVVWGGNLSGQTNVPAGLSNVVAIASGADHCMALKSSGQVVCWGWNSFGQTNVPSGASNVIAMAAGYLHSMALTSDGRVVVWGGNLSGQTNVPAGLSNVVAIAAGEQHCMALKSDGTVICWGWNAYGQTNVPAGVSNVVAIAAGALHSMVLKSDCTVVCWGDSAHPVIATMPSGLKNVIAISSRSYYSLALSYGSSPVSDDNNGNGLSDWWELIYFGDLTHVADEDCDFDGFTNIEEYLHSTSPVDADTDGDQLTDWQEIVVYHTNPNSNDSDEDGLSDSVEINETRNIYAWGTNECGVCTVPEDITTVTKIAAYGYSCIALKSDGKIKCWGLNDSGQADAPADLCGVVDIDAAYGYGMALKHDGTVVCWGDNTYGQLNVPENLSGIVDIAAGGMQCFALRTDGAVTNWGNVSELPDGLDDVRKIDACDNVCVALKSDGTVVCWGNSSYGQTNVPQNLSGIIDIAVGLDHCMALRNDGTVICWGAEPDEYYDPDFGQTNTPSGLSNVVAIAAGYYHSLAIKSDGSIVIWGAEHPYGELTGVRYAPNWLTDVEAAAAGAWHNLAQCRFSPWLNPLSDDSDSDGIPDGWEYSNGMNPADPSDAGMDYDQDGLNNVQEYQAGTSLHLADSDNDGLSDNIEIQMNTNPHAWDSDGDGLSDGDESSYGSNPLACDTDNDGFTDDNEVRCGSSPANALSFPCDISGVVSYSGLQVGSINIIITNLFNGSQPVTVLSSPGTFTISGISSLSNYWISAFCDSNENGSNDSWEAYGAYQLNPVCPTGNTGNISFIMCDPDADSDGMPDYWEIKHFGGLQHGSAGDYDNDGLNNINELLSGSLPTNALSTVKSISGSVSYSGIQTGLVIVCASQNSGDWSSSHNAYLYDMGSYTVSNLPTLASYWIEVYRDSNGNGSYDHWEAYGCYSSNAVYLATNMSGLAVTLNDPDQDLDGLPDYWEMQIVNSNTNDNILSTHDLSPWDDYDHDGSSNSNEYMAGTSPLDPASLISQLQFVTNLVSINEAPTNVNITLTVSPACSSAVQALVYVVSATASNNVDFYFGPTNVTFAPLQASVSIPVTIYRQVEAEPQEIIEFGINLLSGSAALGQRNRCTVIINDDTNGTGYEPAPGWVPDSGDILQFRLLTPVDGAF
ncbi:MAG: hypothetical protein A2283_13635 [Lentisphaerae bacterium RIFOXYA12_FULL_48_11]|nr:MAG: hypothetical protein A2283_13635 [Lentisphaerae bacterium RIFOXYA12_FULL_48_11]